MHMKKGTRGLAKMLLVSVGVGLFVWGVLLLTSAYIITGAERPETLILPAVFALAAVAAFVTGFLGGKLSGNALWGLVCGLLLLALVFCFSFIGGAGQGGVSSLPLKLVLWLEFPFVAFVGGRLSAKSGGKRGTKRRKPARARH